MKIAVGSTNPAKLEAVREAFTLAFPDQEIQIEGVEVSSGVSAQPLGAEETVLGAENRAQGALGKVSGADFGVGLEAGLENIAGHWFTSGWVAVCDSKGRKGIAQSTKIEVAPKIMKLVHEGKELGDAVHTILGKDVRQSSGYFGMMTNQLLTRKSVFIEACVSALASFLHPEVFEAESKI